MDTTLDELRETIATSCRLLAHLGLVRETTGHVSARIEGERMLIRCRGKSEAGLIRTQAEAVHACRFDGSELEHADAYETPTELPIHGELYKARPEVNAVVHAHPRASMLCTILGLELQPIFGAYDPNSMYLAAEGVPMFPRAMLVRDAATGQQLVKSMQNKSVCLMYGHGVATVGASVEEATIKAIQLETLASITLECAKAGKPPMLLGEEDQMYFKRLREAQNAKLSAHNKDVFKWTWRHYVSVLEDHERRA
ncbi:class II aldolase/adducin family protein [Paraburkholderia sp. RL18-101-BIB-B]|jgi:ribulose-5-phosphate 4-epimerase/fuculose-1-phosphate aldolase|uniref:class II aldolase/adducin family protein n=1 Tax=unclassified Paraburkholderia TaxID=2615204 RepID=UPI0038B97CFB